MSNLRMPNERNKNQSITKVVPIELMSDGQRSVIPVTFDPKAVFGKAKAPVHVTIGDFTYSTTIISVSNNTFVPLSKKNREAAGLVVDESFNIVDKDGNDSFSVTFRSDNSADHVEIPAVLLTHLEADPQLMHNWQTLPITSQRESAVSLTNTSNPETIAKRLEKVLSFVASRSIVDEQEQDQY